MVGLVLDDTTSTTTTRMQWDKHWLDLFLSSEPSGA